MAWCGFAASCAPRPDGVSGESLWLSGKPPSRRTLSVILLWPAGPERPSLSAVVKYIRDQEQHHRKISFQEEFLAFLKAHRIPYDERYIWE